MAEKLANTIDVSKKNKIISLILLIIVGTFTNYIYVLTVYVQPLNEFHGWSMNMIVTAFSVSYIVMIPAYAAGGWVSAKFGMKKILVVSAAAYGLSILFSGLATSVYVFIFFMGILSSFAMYGVFMASLMLINVLYPERKGTAMGLLYGFQTLGAAAFSPLANFFIINYSVTAALIIQGVIFTVIMIVCSILVKDPTKGDKELMAKIQEEADAEELAETLKGKAEAPSLKWKPSLKTSGLWLLIISIILIQMFGNVLASDAVYLATTYYGVSSTTASLTTTVFYIAAAIGAIVIGVVSDRIGSYKTTYLLGIIDGILLFVLAIAGTENFMIFIIMASIQGFTYNGMCTLTPVMVTDTFNADDMGAMMALVAIAYTIVGIIGPQLGLTVSFVPMVIICAVCSIAGGILTKSSAKAFNKYYIGIDSKCRIK